MIDLNNVNWRHDRITSNYVNKNADELIYPERMTANRLAETITYTLDTSETYLFNPYAVEMMKRSGHLDKYRMTPDNKERRNIFLRSCRFYGFEMC